MKRRVVNGLAAALVVGAPLAGHSVLSGIRGGPSSTAFASQDLNDQLLATSNDRQVTPRAPTPTPAAAATPRATPTAAPAPRQAPGQAPGKATGDKAAGEKAGGDKAATDKAPASAAPAQAPKAASAPAQAPRAAAAPAQHPAALPRTGGLPLEGVALLATTLLGAGLGLRRFWRK